MFPRYGDTRGMDHMRLHPARPQPARQPEAVPTSLEGQCNPRDLFTGPNSLISTTAIIVLSWSRATRDLLKSFGWGIGALHRFTQRRWCHLLAACPMPGP